MGAALPNLTLPLLNGTTVTLDSLVRGHKGLVLDFWFAACGPCKAEFRHLEAIYPQLTKQNISVLAVDRLDTVPQVKKYLKDFPLRLPVALNGTGKNAVDPAFGITGSPTTVVIDSQGTVAAVFEGEDDLGLSKALKTLG